jgi:hypothetical protein
MLAIFLVRGARTQKNGLKTHLSKVSNDYAPKVNREQVQATTIRAPESTTHVEFRTPLAFLPLSGGGGGVRNRGRISPTVQIGAPGSTTMKTILDPPCLSTFKQRGGVRNRASNFRRLRLRRPDQRRSGNPILLSHSGFN